MRAEHLLYHISQSRGHVNIRLLGASLPRSGGCESRIARPGSLHGVQQPSRMLDGAIPVALFDPKRPHKLNVSLVSLGLNSLHPSLVELYRIVRIYFCLDCSLYPALQYTLGFPNNGLSLLLMYTVYTRQRSLCHAIPEPNEVPPQALLPNTKMSRLDSS